MWIFNRFTNRDTALRRLEFIFGVVAEKRFVFYVILLWQKCGCSPVNDFLVVDSRLHRILAPPLVVGIISGDRGYDLILSDGIGERDALFGLTVGERKLYTQFHLA